MIKYTHLDKIMNKTNLKKLVSLLFFIMAGAAGISFAQVKQTATVDILPSNNLSEKNKNLSSSDTAETNKDANSETVQKLTENIPLCGSLDKSQSSFLKGDEETDENAEKVKRDSSLLTNELTKKEKFAAFEPKPEKQFVEKTTTNFSDQKTAHSDEKFHWKPALIESGIFLGIKHGFRMFQPKTTRELGGPFFRDWAKSVKNLRGWNDGDSPFTNNFAHPLQGGVTGRIFVNNSDRARKLEFGKSTKYWNSRFKAFVWSAAWSTQFEFGPVSEATIGNVGLREKNGHSTAGWTDLIMTPVVGTGVVIGEDAIDRYILKNWLERKTNGKTTVKIKILRSVLTPTTTFSNLLRGKAPWKRNNR